MGSTDFELLNSYTQNSVSALLTVLNSAGFMNLKLNYSPREDNPQIYMTNLSAHFQALGIEDLDPHNSITLYHRIGSIKKENQLFFPGAVHYSISYDQRFLESKFRESFCQLLAKTSQREVVVTPFYNDKNYPRIRVFDINGGEREYKKVY